MAGIRPVIVTDTWWHGIAPGGLLAAPDALAVILSYEGAVTHKPAIVKVRWDVLICDEIHYAKNPAAKRTRAIFGFQRENHPDHVPPIKAARRIGLSGTPIVNRPAELWPLVHAFDRAGLGATQKDYNLRYIGPVMIPDPPKGMGYIEGGQWRVNYERKVKVNRMTELHDRLRASFMVRRLKADVLKDLPAKRRQIVLLDPEGMADVLSAERRAIAEKAAELAQLKHENAVEKLRMWRGAAMTEISRIRHETALRKLPAVIEHLFQVLDETPKVVIFAHHHDVVDGLISALPGMAVAFDGRMNDMEKEDAVRRFQADASVRVFVGSIRAAGLGITLTAASVVLFAELDWTPSAMVQAEDRLHRIGQRDSVFVQHLVVDGSIDQRMATILIAKAATIDAILDGKMPAEAQESVLDSVLKG